MGHHVTGKSNIVPLIDRLNRYPIGLPDSEKLRQILAILFSEEEAFIASRFPLQEATLAELVKSTGYEAEQLQVQLERMAEKGLIMDLTYGKHTYYLLLPGLIGFFELTFMKNRQDLPVKELAELMHDYLFGGTDRAMADEFFGSRTPLTRAMSYEEHIPVDSQVAPYEQAREIVKTAKYGAVGMCYCRHKREHLGLACEKNVPKENICISLGSAAKFMVRRGFAEHRTTEELLEILDRARQLKLTHITDNIRNKPSFICNCCSCCCELLGGVLHGYTDGVAKSGFTLQINLETCVGCALCAKACNADAIDLEPLAEIKDKGPKKQAKVKDDNCLGCGGCISSCPTGSLSLVRVDRPVPPENKKALFMKILKEKKRLSPYVIGAIKKKFLQPFLRK